MAGAADASAIVGIAQAAPFTTVAREGVDMRDQLPDGVRLRGRNETAAERHSGSAESATRDTQPHL
ncbi:hypothetical protein GCM10025872_38420 [Barrientosiimonas endolithica]|uniref:Uncharacterized protein n=1 Tax=Barrientosiimonas endolithica TaxID=1535208 RepID=A0ABM8HGL0_9MICO|nr:hypothetical protein GCM10025872_00100 [Barrientosiimonas endolithica]BDZ60185.1 hypothetical protein GCM10025872_38420 [Barrientosiimonas endolithica]